MHYLILHLFKVFLLEPYLFGYRLCFLLKGINLLLVDRNVLYLMPAQATIDVLKLLGIHAIFEAVLLGLFRILNCLLDSLLEVCDLIVDKVLVYLHLLFEVPHLTFIYKLQYPGRSIFNSVDTFVLKVKHFLSDLPFEISIRPIVNILSLKVEYACL
jgi:hypothetical protein